MSGRLGTIPFFWSLIMKNRQTWRTLVMMAVFGLAMAKGSRAQDPLHFSGLISDYTPVSGVAGPWEMRGEWSLSLDSESATANFSATLNMTHSDYWVVMNPGAADDNSSAGRHPHTHHIALTHAKVTPLATGGFEVTGPALVTVDGNAAPFMPKCTSMTPCTLTVDITGGTVVALSNLTMTFVGPPTGHFGAQPIHGVVRRPR
jgi:hypothetical protein